MPARSPDRIVIALVAIALILGVGIATFFLSPDTKDEGDDSAEYVELDLSTVSGSDVPAEQVLYLPWGTGPAEASRKGTDVDRSTIEAVFSSAGFVFVVDHPEGVSGARVRWFTAQGDLAGSHLAPPGSTFFRPHEGGLNYVIAKSGGRSETAAIWNVLTSAETTYAVPLQMNSGGLVAFGDTLYASVTPSDVDHEKQVIYSRQVLVPVAVGGVQVDDATADAGALELWGFGMDGEQYTSLVQVMGLDVATSDVITVVGSGDRRVRVPRRFRILGVAPDSTIYLNTLPPEVTPERAVQLAAAWNSSREPFDQVLAINLDGTVESCIVLPYSTVLARYDGTIPMSLSVDGLYTLRADEGGVAVVLHRFQ